VGSLEWKFVSRGLLAGGLTLLSNTGWLACAQRVVLSRIPSEPGFEMDTTPGLPSRYFWRSRNVSVQLDVDGGMSLRFPDGREVGISFVGAKSGVEPQGESEAYPVSYYLGPASSWHSSVRWQRVRYRELYPGIDLVLVSSAQQLEYTFEVRPDADPGKIRIRYRGAAVGLNRAGNVVIRMGRDQIEQRRPIAFQSAAFQGAFEHPGDGGRAVQCRYQLQHSEVTLRIGRYDVREPLTIDPKLNFGTYLGGASYDAIYAIATDSAGNVYVAGETSSGSIPGGQQPARSSRDAWVAKLNSSGSTLLYLVYLGGTGNDSGRGVAVDASGNAYITGITASTNFPTTSGAFSSTIAGLQEAFVTKLSSIGQIEYSTYLGGGSDAGFAIAVDTSGGVYVAGQTASSTFPVTTGTIQHSNAGGISDCFVSKLNAAGSSLVYSTYLGGSGLDLCSGIAIDTSNDAYVTGTTYSTNIPTQAPVQGSLVGTASAFVAELNPTATALLYSTYLGGSILDNGNAIAVDSSGSAYVAGTTASPDFPTTAGAVQTILGGTYNAFVSKLAPRGSGLTYSTFLGGSGIDTADAIAVDSSGQAVVGGYTSSPNFPVASAIQPTFGGYFDAFATVLNASGTGLVFSSYFGGSGDDRAYAVATLPGLSLALGGMTASTNFPTATPLQSSFDGTYDGFAISAQYQAAVVSGGGLAFYPLVPCRVADTRVGSGFSGAFGAPSLVGGEPRTFPIPASSCDVPVTAQAYSFNVTVVPPGALAYLSAWPTGLAIPQTTTLNSLNGSIVGNAAIVQAGTGGAVNLLAANGTDVVIDVNGYFAPPGSPQALGYYPVTPCRVADTRAGSGFTGVFGPPSLVGAATRNFPVQQSPCGIPSTAQAYVLRMTVVAPGPLFYLTTWPAGLPLPIAATLNALNGGVVGNLAIVPDGAATGGPISVYVSQKTDLVIDINGYFPLSGSLGSLHFYPLPPCRAADTRVGSGYSGFFGQPSLVGGATRNFPLLSSSCGIPSSAQAYSLNMTAVVPSGGGLNYMTAYPAGDTLPIAATLNAVTGGEVGAATLLPVGTNGAISVYVSQNTDLLIDVNGYFAP
jgi:Beta-propeller repeat